jgi:hypothetical protein
VDSWQQVPRSIAATIPERPGGAATGSAFIKRLEHLGDDAREQEILAELQHGNLPSFLRHLRPVDVVARASDGQEHRGRFWTMPDYLAIGADGDFVRIPMSSITAQVVADKFDCLLPTRKMVDEIYRQSQIRLSPEPLPAGPEMTSSEYYWHHNEIIAHQLVDGPLGELVSGHKKDVVITNELLRRPTRVAIYGWHKPDGQPIQPLSLFHPNWYADYSHGIRLVAAMMIVDGVQRPVADVLKDQLLAPLLSDEGPMQQTRVCTDRSRSRCVDAMLGESLASRAH